MVDKLALTNFDEIDVVCIYVKYLLIKCHFELRDYDRCVRLIELLSKRVFSLYKKRRLKRETANLLLQVHKIWGDIHMAKSRFQKASEVYQEVIDLYAIWRSCQYRITNDVCVDFQDHEFTDDAILEVKSSCGEALMGLGETLPAIDRFEEAKKQFQKCLVFSNEIVYINICNQLAN